MVFTTIIISFLFFLIALGPLFKTIAMMRCIFAINPKKEFRLPERISKLLNLLITILAFTTGIYYAIYKLDITFYFLLMGTSYTIILRLNSYFSSKILFHILIAFPILAILGNFTGRIALDIKSPLFLEIIFMSIFVATPAYLNYKFIFPKKKLEKQILEYSSLFKELPQDNITIKSTVSDINNSINWFTELKKLEIYSEKNLQKLRLQYSLKNKKIKLSPEFGLKSSILRLLVNKDEERLNKVYRNKDSFEKFSEVSSLISGGRIGGSLQESLLMACWYAKQFFQSNMKTENTRRLYELELTKSQHESLSKLKFYNFFLSFYSFYANEEQKADFFNYFKKYRYFLILERGVWVRRSKNIGLCKPLIKSLNMEIEESKKILDLIITKDKPSQINNTD